MLRKVIFIFLLSTLFGCSSLDLEELADDSKEAKAKAYIQQLVNGDYKEIKEAIAPGLKSKLTNDVFKQMTDLLGTEDPSEITLIGYSKFTFNKEPTRYNVSYQYGYEDKWILANVAFLTLGDGKDEIFGLNVHGPLDRPLQEIHRFTLNDKGIIAYLFLVGCILVPLFIIFTLIVAIRAKFERRKWLWIAFILVGLVRFSLNWTTGQVTFSLLHLQLFGAGAFSAGAYSPWVLTVALPIGALLFWVKRRGFKQKEKKSLQEKP